MSSAKETGSVSHNTLLQLEMSIWNSLNEAVNKIVERVLFSNWLISVALIKKGDANAASPDC
jgi:hypothetical protein